jgi:hypothetical protein
MVYFAPDCEKATENNGQFQKCDGEDEKYVKKKKRDSKRGRDEEKKNIMRIHRI